jgi:hypothetical protein
LPAPQLRLAAAMTATAVIAVGGLTSIGSSAYAVTPHPAVGTTVTSTAFGGRIYTTYEKTGILEVIIGARLPSPAELAPARTIPGAATPDTDEHCGYGGYTETCLTVTGSGAYVDEMACEGFNISPGTLNMDVRLYNPPPSAYNLRGKTGYHSVGPGQKEGVYWYPYNDVMTGTYTCTTWIGGQGVNSLAQVGVVLA